MVLGLFLEFLVFLFVLMLVGLLSTVIGFFLASGESFHVPVDPFG